MQKLDCNAMVVACGRRCFICNKPIDVGNEFAELPIAFIEEQRRVGVWKDVVSLPYVIELHYEHLTDKQKRR